MMMNKELKGTMKNPSRQPVYGKRFELRISGV